MPTFLMDLNWPLSASLAAILAYALVMMGGVVDRLGWRLKLLIVLAVAVIGAVIPGRI